MIGLSNFGSCSRSGSSSNGGRRRTDVWKLGAVLPVDMEMTSLHILNVPLTVIPICMTWTEFPGADLFYQKMGPGGPFFH